MRALAVFLLATLLLGAAPTMAAVAPEERLSDPVLEDRARELAKELRCLVCQNQSIDDSDAPLAKDLRAVVRERLVAGDSNAQVLDFVTARYGDFVLLSPPMRASTWFLWFGPAVILVVAGAILVARRRAGRQTAAVETAPLSAEEQAAADRLLDGPDTAARP